MNDGIILWCTKYSVRRRVSFLLIYGVGGDQMKADLIILQAMDECFVCFSLQYDCKNDSARQKTTVASSLSNKKYDGCRHDPDKNVYGKSLCAAAYDMHIGKKALIFLAV